MSETLKEHILTTNEWTKLSDFPNQRVTIKNTSGKTISIFCTTDEELVPTDEYFQELGMNPIELGGLNFEHSTSSANEIPWAKAIEGSGIVIVRIYGTVDPSEDIVSVANALNNLTAEVHTHLDTTSGNPHKVTKQEVGLGNIPNSITDDPAKGDSKTLATSKATKEIVDNLNSHTSNLENPHQVTKDQVGLGKVVNLPLANGTTAIDATNNEVYMTPYTTHLAVNSWISISMNVHAQTVVKGPVASRTLGWSVLDCSYPTNLIQKINDTSYKVNGGISVAFADAGKTRITPVSTLTKTLTIPTTTNATLYVYTDINAKAIITDFNHTLIQPYEGMERAYATGDYWNVAENVMYDENDTPIRRVYIGKVFIANGKIASVLSVPIGHEHTLPILNEIALGRNYLYDCPFIGIWDAKAEVEYNYKWGVTGWNDQSGVVAHPYPANKIDQFILQCGLMGFLSCGRESGSPLGNDFETVTTPLRARVTFTKKY